MTRFEEGFPPDDRQRALGQRFGEFTVYPRSGRLTTSGRTVDIEPKALHILLTLLEHRDRVVGKEELHDRVWEGAFITDNALSRAVARLRKALGDDPKDPRFIETVHGLGYRFVAAVEKIRDETTHAPADRDRPAAAPVPMRSSPWLAAAAALLGAARYPDPRSASANASPTIASGGEPGARAAADRGPAPVFARPRYER